MIWGEKGVKKERSALGSSRSGGSYSESDYQLHSRTFIPDLLVQLIGSIITKDRFSSTFSVPDLQ